VRSEALPEVRMKNTVFWDVTQCSLVDMYQWFAGTCCRYLLLGRIRQQLSSETLAPHRYQSTLRMEAVISTKHWSLSTRFHGDTSRKTVNLILTLFSTYFVRYIITFVTFLLTDGMSTVIRLEEAKNGTPGKQNTNVKDGYTV
jgi:hypothetical protein